MKIMAVSLWIAVGTAVVSLIISFYTEIDTIKSTTEKYIEQYISFADQEFNDMLVESKKVILSIAMAQEFISPNLVEKKICANLKRLSTGMEAVRAGDLGVRMEIAVPDEIGALADTFNVMMDQIETLMAEVLLKEKRKREAEQEVLASQIEPHFLYNSIDSIRYVAHMRGESEIEQVADALSQLLRSVLSNHNEFITLWEEKDYIENYMTIERFKLCHGLRPSIRCMYSPMCGKTWDLMRSSTSQH